MDAVLAQLTETPLIVVCGHDAWASVRPGGGEWVCAAGFRHPIFASIAASAAWSDAVVAWGDLADTEHPAALVEFRRCQRNLEQADRQARLAIDASNQPRLTKAEQFVAGFLSAW